MEGVGDLKVRLQPVGQAQAWWGEVFGVIWEGYFAEGGRGEDWQAELASFWRAVEQDMGCLEIFTQPREPTWPEGYTGFLSRLGYAPAPGYPDWWRAEKAGRIGGER